MIRTNKFQVIRWNLLLLGVVVLLLTMTALASTQASASSATQSAPAKVESQPARVVNPRPQAATVTINLCASDGSITLPDSTNVTVWGFVETASCGPNLVNDSNFPGPTINANAGDTVNINLANALGENVSILISGQNLASTGGTPGIFAAEAPSGGSVMTVRNAS